MAAVVAVSTLLTVKATEAEYQGWKARATECGLTLSAWVRMILNGVAGDGLSSRPPVPAGPVPARETGPANHSGAGAASPQGSMGSSEAIPPLASPAPESNSAAGTEGPRVTSGPHDAAEGSNRSASRGARSSGKPGTHRRPSGHPAAQSGTGVSKPLGTPRRDDGPAPAGAPVPDPARCIHPREARQQLKWGTRCGACGALVR